MSSGGSARLARFWQEDGEPSLISSARSFQLPVGPRIDADGVDGYYVDFSVKAAAPKWPPKWLPDRERQYHVATAQWGLGCFERYLAGQGDEWLAGATGAARHLADEQAADGGWYHHSDLPHTYRLPAPWLSAMAQGEAASLLVRIHRETGEERFARAARDAIAPLTKPTRAGGVAATLNGGFFPEEYPTRPPSFVLNGGIFALWGCRDVNLALGDLTAGELFDAGIDALARSIALFDTGSWSLYDLFPHPIPNVASSAYHSLHISQLEAMQMIAPRPQVGEVLERFRRYRESPLKRADAFARKVAFRVTRPRNPRFAEIGQGRGIGLGRDHLLVLCYHAVSTSWKANLAIHPDDLRRQLSLLLARGYRGATFTDALAAGATGKVVVVTFDDAFRSVGAIAKPILDELGIPATIFVPSGPVSEGRSLAWRGTSQWVGGPFESELEALSWAELRALADDGWEIGSHTVSHPQLTELGDGQIADELARSKSQIEESIGRMCTAIAYPYGDVDERVAAIAAEAGYEYGASLASDLRDRGDLRRPRVGIYNRDSDRRFRVKISPAVGRFRASSAFEPVAALVGRLRRLRRR